MEFFGSGVNNLSIADRATISNMCPEYGATCAYFPIDERTIEYLKQSNRNEQTIDIIDTYLQASKMKRNFGDPLQAPQFSQIVELLQEMFYSYLDMYVHICFFIRKYVVRR